MTHNPVTGSPIDTRFQYVVVSGPSIGRLCDALKYWEGPRDCVEVRFTYLSGLECATSTIRSGEVYGLVGSAPGRLERVSVRFKPEGLQTLWEIEYWPRRKKGVITDLSLRDIYSPTGS